VGGYIRSNKIDQCILKFPLNFLLLFLFLLPFQWFLLQSIVSPFLPLERRRDGRLDNIEEKHTVQTFLTPIWRNTKPAVNQVCSSIVVTGFYYGHD